MKKVVIFDFDGTIANTTELSYQVYEGLFAHYKEKKLSHKEIDDLKRLPLKERMKKQKVSSFKIPSLIRKTRKILAEIIDQAEIYADMKEMLYFLKEQGVILIIVSSNSASNIKVFLKKEKIDVFDHIEAGSSYFGKARRIKKILKRINIKTRDALYIGDEIRDIKASHQIGIEVIAVAYGFDDKELLKEENPTYLASSVAEIKAILMSK